MVRALQSMPDRDLARDQIDDDAGDDKGRNLARSAFVQEDRGFVDCAQTARAGADENSGPLGLFSGFGTPAGMGDGLIGRSNAVKNELVDAFLLARRQGGIRIKGVRIIGTAAPAILAGNNASDPACEITGIKMFNGLYARLPGYKPLPDRLDSASQRRNDTQPGNNNTAHDNP